MWGLFLQGTDDLFSDDLPIKFGPLLNFDVGEGIDDVHWGPMPEDFERNSDDADNAPATRAVPESTLYDEDLLSLLVEDDEEQDVTEASTSEVADQASPARPPRRRQPTRAPDHDS